MIQLVYLIFTFVCHAHDGHNEHGEIHNGELAGNDGVHYLDAGASVEWANQKLLRTITNNNQVIYHYVGSLPLGADLTRQNKELELKVPGGEKLKGFSFNHAGERPSPTKVISPNLTAQFEISKRSNFIVLWDSTQPATIVRIIIEVFSNTGEIAGRLTISTNDDGEFTVPSNFLNQLPIGKAQLAVKRIWVGGFYPEKDNVGMMGIRMASSVIGKAVIVQ